MPFSADLQLHTGHFPAAGPGRDDLIVAATTWCGLEWTGGSVRPGLSSQALCHEVVRTGSSGNEKRRKKPIRNVDSRSIARLLQVGLHLDGIAYLQGMERTSLRPGKEIGSNVSRGFEHFVGNIDAHAVPTQETRARANGAERVRNPRAMNVMKCARLRIGRKLIDKPVNPFSRPEIAVVLRDSGGNPGSLSPLICKFPVDLLRHRLGNAAKYRRRKLRASAIADAPALAPVNEYPVDYVHGPSKKVDVSRKPYFGQWMSTTKRQETEDKQKKEALTAPTRISS
jgi:hypothetical protein